MRKSLFRFTNLLFVLSLFLFSSQVFAQTSISGRVTDAATGEPLIGATVVVLGSSTGTVTDLDGQYEIRVPGTDAVLEFTYVGYETQDIEVGNQTIIDVSMIESATELEDVVVIGYGTVKKEDLTGAVSVVTSEDLNRTPASTFQKALQGRAPGVFVSQTSGRPGSGTNIYVRGIGSINRNANPIYIVDGIRTGSLNQINPADIESLQVLKDASSAAIYGNDGANGVVIITTKRGQSGAPKVHYSSYYSFHNVPKRLELMNADQYSDFFNEVYDSAGLRYEDNPDFIVVPYSDEFRQAYYGEGWETGTDWQDEITQTGMTVNQFLRVSGGSEKSNYSISANYWDETGILLKNRATRYSVRANSDFQIGDRIKVGQTINIARFQSRNGAGNFNFVKTSSPLLRVYNEDNKEGYAGAWDSFGFDANLDGTVDSTENFNVAGNNDKYNARGQAELFDDDRYSTNILGSIYAEIAFTDWLKFRTMPSVDFTQGRRNEWHPAFDMRPRSISFARREANYYDNRSLAWENMLTFDKYFGDHRLQATAVYEVRRFDSDNINARSDGFPYEQLPIFSQGGDLEEELSGGKGIFRSVSYLARVIYDYKGKYLFTGSVRRDGNTRFLPGNQYGTFPAFSVGWKLNEDLLPQVDQIDMLKVRFGWGLTGNSNIGNFEYDDFLDAPNVFAPVFGDNGGTEASGQYIYYSFANPLIGWESAAMTNFGFDLNMFRNKIQVTAEYYLKNQSDLLVRKDISAVFGRSFDGSFPWVNLGNVQNRGFEFTGSFRETRGDFYYSLAASLTTVKNEVLDIPNTIIQGNTITQIGRPIGALYGYVAERIVTEEDYDEEGNYLYAEPVEGEPSPGDLMFKDINNDGLISNADRTLIGKALPDMIYSLSVDLEYKGFDFNVFFSGMQNFQIFNQERAQLSSFNSQDLDHQKLLAFSQNFYREDRPSTEYVRADLNNENVNDRISTWWIEEGSFLRVKDIQLGYTLPSSLLNAVNVSSLRIYGSIANAWLFTSYTGRDPENAAFSSPLNSGTDGGGYPNPRTYSVGISVDF